MQGEKEKERKHRCRFEFDEFVHGYRQKQDKLLWLSGETSEYFALYKVQKLSLWLPEFKDRNFSVLDYGCGDGLMTSYMRSYFPKARVFGTDPSLESIEAAQKHFSDISFSVIDREVVPYEDSKFEMIFAAGVFHHIPFCEHRHWLDEIFRVLKKDGVFILFDINPLNPIAHYVFKTHPLDQSAKMLYPLYARKILKNYGSVKTFFYCFFPRFARMFRPLERYISWLPFGAHHAHVVCNRKKL
ncbi:class I SAM-dependent methyltransferase [Candidatus Dependentiae bacterium]